MINQRVERIPLLDADACEAISLQVLLLKKHWIKRHHMAPFYTLEMAAYLDDNTQDDGIKLDYLAHNISSCNDLLVAYFAALYQQLECCFYQRWGLVVRFNLRHLALPGFHIYEPHPFFEKLVASTHKDLQYRNLFGHKARAHSEDVMTFTLPLSTPAGAGLNLWEDDSCQDADLFVPYHSGELVVHSGLEQHQAVINCTSGDERITLQGHGIIIEQQLILYW